MSITVIPVTIGAMPGLASLARRHILSKTAALGACTLGLALLAGCSLYFGDPEPPPPPPPPPPALPGNVSNDEYDPAHHRVLLGDCLNGTLQTVELVTGERSVLIDTWPWTEPPDWLCVTSVMSDRDGRRAFATVRRFFPDPDRPYGTCESRDLVAIDTETRAITESRNIHSNCCFDCFDSQGLASLQLDEVHERLLYLELDCSFNDGCSYYLAATPFGTQESVQLNVLHTPDCSGDCNLESRTDIMSLVFDPTAPYDRVLLLVRENFPRVYYLDSLELAAGTRSVVAVAQTTWPDFQVEEILDVSVDAEWQRVLLTAWGGSEQAGYGVIAIDLVTGEQALLYDGRPAANGSRLSCVPNAAFDSRERRLLLFEPIDESGCTGGIFAVDADMGAFTQIAGRIE